jgi:iron(III) transport system substrate-binding protein
MKKRLLTLLLAALCICSFGASAALAGEILVYTALEDDQIPVYMESFKAAHPEIDVKFVRDSTGIVIAKLLAEKDNPQADLVWGTSGLGLIALEDIGLLEPYAPKGVDKVLPEFKDTKTPPTWVANNVFETGICVNEYEIKDMDIPMPKSYADLIKPIYKGKLVMPNPNSSGTGYLTVAGILSLFGEEKGWEYMDKLHENIAIYTHSGSKPCKMAGVGEFPIGISYGYRGVMQKRKGEPIITVFPAEGSGWDTEANALIHKPDIKPEAKVFLDWAISMDAMKAYAKNYSILSVPNVPGFQIPEGYPADPVGQLVKMDVGKASRDRAAVLKEWERRYGSKSAPKN